MLLQGKLAQIEALHGAAADDRAKDDSSAGSSFAFIYRRGQCNILAHAIAHTSWRLGRVSEACAGAAVSEQMMELGLTDVLLADVGDGAHATSDVHLAARSVEAGRPAAAGAALETGARSTLDFVSTESVVVTSPVGAGDSILSVTPAALLTARRLRVVAPTLAAVLARVEGGLDDEFLLSLLVMHEAARASVSPWGAMLRRAGVAACGSGASVSGDDGADGYRGETRDAGVTPRAAKRARLEHRSVSDAKHATADREPTPAAQLVARDLAERSAEFHELYEPLEELLSTVAVPGRTSADGAGAAYTADGFERAMAFVLSHAVPLRVGVRSGLCVLPLLPRPRFSLCANSELVFDANAGAVVVRALRALGRGEEVTLSYDALEHDARDRLELLGFAVRDAQARAVAVNIGSLMPSPSDHTSKTKRADVLDAVTGSGRVWCGAAPSPPALAGDGAMASAAAIASLDAVADAACDDLPVRLLLALQVMAMSAEDVDAAHNLLQRVAPGVQATIMLASSLSLATDWRTLVSKASGPPLADVVGFAAAQADRLHELARSSLYGEVRREPGQAASDAGEATAAASSKRGTSGAAAAAMEQAAEAVANAQFGISGLHDVAAALNALRKALQ